MNRAAQVLKDLRAIQQGYCVHVVPCDGQYEAVAYNAEGDRRCSFSTSGHTRQDAKDRIAPGLLATIEHWERLADQYRADVASVQNGV